MFVIEEMKKRTMSYIGVFLLGSVCFFLDWRMYQPRNVSCLLPRLYFNPSIINMGCEIWDSVYTPLSCHDERWRTSPDYIYDSGKCEYLQQTLRLWP